MVTKRLDLRRGLHAAVGSDLLEYPKASFDPLHMLRVLSALFGGKVALYGDLLFLDPQPHTEWRQADGGEWNKDPNPA